MPGEANTVSTDAPRPRPGRSPRASACEPYREWIEEEVRQSHGHGDLAGLGDDHGFLARYASVRRFVVKLRAEAPREAHPVIETKPGEEAQVDYGDGPMVRHPETGNPQVSTTSMGPRSRHCTQRSRIEKR
jgi:transposase